jgi:D-alanyl-D-alanine carboxypeptidase
LTKAVGEFTIVQLAAKTQKYISYPELGYKGKPKKKSKKEPVKKPNKIVNNPTSHYFGHEGIIAIKTGFTNAAGFCITILLKANDQLYNITILGARSKKEREKIIKQSLAKIYNT